MNRKLLASDFDGTLCHRYTPDGYPATEDVLEAIREFRADGGLFGVVTGRDWRWSWYELDQNGRLDFDYIIALDGAQVYDRAGNLIIGHTADGGAMIGDKTLARALAERCWEVVGDYFALICGEVRYHFSAHLPDGGEEDGDQYSPHTMLDQIGAFHMAGAIGEPGTQAAEAGELLRREFGDYINPQPNGRSLDIPPRGVDKGSAIREYARLMNIAEDDIFTAGDNYNDIAMLKPFHGCAMENGVAAAKEAAEYVCRDIADVIAVIRKTDHA